MKLRKWTNIYPIILIYLLAIVIFFLFRVILFFSEIERASDADLSDIFYSFFIGLRFDIVISGYILALPFLILTVFFLLRRKNATIQRILFYFILTLFSISFFVSAADIPFFRQNFSRFSVTAFEWLDTPGFVVKMIIQEPRYWFPIIPFLLFTFFFYKILKRILKLSDQVEPFTGNIFVKSVISILFLGLMFLGIRGRVDEKSPIRVGTAYFSNNAFLNQLGLNPNFTLIRSILDKMNNENNVIQLMNNEEAIAEMQKYLNIPHPNENFPLLRKIQKDTLPAHRYNVVLVIMESMSYDKTQKRWNGKNLTPFLDSISDNGFYFKNIYSSGIHTFNGIYSTLFSYPALFRQHSMNESAMKKYDGMPSVLKSLGYSTVYFTTHDGQFDNVEGFLRLNDIEKVIAKADYPADKIRTTLGVPDDFMFEFSIPVLNELASNQKPFFATFMTASDHGPYYVPEYFKSDFKDTKEQIVEYADWSLKKFIEMSSKEKWFDSTLFVFIADHGAPIDATYEMPLSFNHVPFIIYNPQILSEKKTFDCMGGQIDVFPTLMGVLNQEYTNNTLGIDLLKEKRSSIFFNGDDKFGVINDEWLLIVREDKTLALHKYQNKDTKDYSAEYPQVVSEMRKYAEANLQSCQYVINTGKQNGE